MSSVAVVIGASMVKKEYSIIFLGHFSPVLHKNICGIHNNYLISVALVSTYNTCFYGEIKRKKNIPELLLETPS